MDRTLCHHLLRPVTTVPPIPSRRVRRVRGRRSHSAFALLFAAAVLAFASPATADLTAQPAADTSVRPAPSPSVPTPTTHTYEDDHSGQQPDGSSPALWILAGALAGLVAIAIVMIRAGRPPRHQLTRRHDG